MEKESKIAAHAAAEPSIIEKFSIEGLFGYRSVSFSSKNAATVLIARNGSGKTTLIAALDAFLKGQFSRFAGLDFEKITCRLRGCIEELVIKKEDVDKFIDITRYPDLMKSAKAWDIQPNAFLELLEIVPNSNFLELYDNPTFYSIYSKVGYEPKEAYAVCEKLAQSVDSKNEYITKIKTVIRFILKDIEIVYLPTYRRIELSLPESDDSRRMSSARNKRNILSKLGVERNGLYTADIQFGLGDISDRLKVIYSEMLSVSNREYGKVSANIINDLISGEYKKASYDNSSKPTKEALEIFFNRVKQADRGNRIGHYSNYFVSPNLDRIFIGDIPKDAAPFLNYFLEQLNSIIEQTKGKEELVEEFINSCNNYLSSKDDSIDEFCIPEESDNKILIFDRKSFSVRVVSQPTNHVIPMESLSSGEKQMISLFARLYLYDKNKILLIDEPELSLSLDWQRKILLDVLKAPSCKQVVAITHSPFIFDNILEMYAGALKLKLNYKGVKRKNKGFGITGEE